MEVLRQARTPVPLPPINIADSSIPFNAADPSNVDLQELKRLWYDHQTKRAASDERTSKKPSLTSKQLSKIAIASKNSWFNHETMRSEHRQQHRPFPSMTIHSIRDNPNDRCWSCRAGPSHRKCHKFGNNANKCTGNCKNGMVPYFVHTQLSHNHFHNLGRRKNVFCMKYYLTVTRHLGRDLDHQFDTTGHRNWWWERSINVWLCSVLKSADHGLWRYALSSQLSHLTSWLIYNLSYCDPHQKLRGKWAALQHYQRVKYWQCFQPHSSGFWTPCWLPVPGHSALSGIACEALRLPAFIGISLCSDWHLP